MRRQQRASRTSADAVMRAHSTCPPDAAGSCTRLPWHRALWRRSARARLVVGAETISRILDWEDRGTAVLFGDGAGAVVVAAQTGLRVAEGAPAGILGFDLGGDGPGPSSSPYLRGFAAAGLCRTVEARQHYMKMNGSEVSSSPRRVVAQSAGRVLEKCGRPWQMSICSCPIKQSSHHRRGCSKLASHPTRSTPISRSTATLVCLYPPLP